MPHRYASDAPLAVADGTVSGVGVRRAQPSASKSPTI